MTNTDKWNWNPDGTGEFALYECRVTSVVYADGSVATTKEEDPIIGEEIITNPNVPPAKLVDIDPEIAVPTLYGMTLHLNWGKKDAFSATWTPASILNDMFRRQNPDDPYRVAIGTQGRSLMGSLLWSQTLNSKALQQLKYFSDISDFLSISFSVYNFTKNPNATWYKHGRILGSIGVGRREESLSFPGHRVLLPSPQAPAIKLPENQLSCKINKFLMGNAYFNLDMRRLTLDLGNSFCVDSEGHLCKLDPLYVGILLSTSTERSVVELIAEVPYRKNGWYEKTAGVQDFLLSDKHHRILSSSRLVLVVIRGSGPVPRLFPVCSTSAEPVSVCAALVLIERPVFIRPLSSFLFHLEKDQHVTLHLLARKFGKPLPNAELKLEDTSLFSLLIYRDQSYTANSSYFATEGLQFNWRAVTDASGIATFVFRGKGVTSRKDTLGRIYNFRYCLGGETTCSDFNIGNSPTFLVWSNETYQRPYFWDRDIQPIFQWYERLFPVMSRIVALGDYESVTTPYILALMKKSMSLNINHPSYMPVNRALSPTKMNMILEWLDSPNHYRSWEHKEVVNFWTPEFCKFTFHLDPQEGSIQIYSGNVSTLQKMDIVGHQYTDQYARLAKHPSPRVLPVWVIDSAEQYCSLSSLKRDLQDAIALEFSTIPPYLTALYSIKDGYNKEVYKVIRSVVVQEMLHVAQAANLLISIGGRPIIDSEEYAPSYPGHLPAGILPGLVVSLKKASPKHISEVFMAIEYPHMNINDFSFHPDLGTPLITLGHFYSHIRRCMTKLNTERNIFCRECAQTQIQWPSKNSDPSSFLHTVTDLNSALHAIEMIVEQGEGASSKDPTYLETHMLSHFYKFEELACRRHMSMLHRHTYKYGGDTISFVPEGVWPMRDHPSKEDIPKNTPLHHEAKHFHKIYRSLLTSLQDAFDGVREAMTESMFIMESLSIHMKRLMEMPVPTKPGWPEQTCGPVFDYNWD